LILALFKRIGHGADIVDYVLGADQRINPMSINSGSSLDIYFKILFQWDIEHPIVGVILKSKEGVIVYGINTDWMKRQLRPVKQGDVRIYRFSIRIDLSAGDWFTDLAVTETPAEICDHRSALINVYIMDLGQSVGLASLQTQFDEIQDDVSTSQASSPDQKGGDEAFSEWSAGGIDGP
jgi:lipopolysaccharide transport system ATP-binding protein